MLMKLLIAWWMRSRHPQVPQRCKLGVPAKRSVIYVRTPIAITKSFHKKVISLLIKEFIAARDLISVSLAQRHFGSVHICNNIIERIRARNPSVAGFVKEVFQIHPI